MKRLLWCCLPVLLLLTACSKDPLKDMTADESRIYITNYDTLVQFQQYQTFSIADSVAVIENNQLLGREAREIDTRFIQAVTAALESRGYVRVNRNDDPDLGITISRVTNTTTNLVSYPDYGGYYGDYWDPFYWDYPGYNYYFPTYYGIYQTSETALLIDVLDLMNVQNNQIRSVWSGLIRGTGIFNNASVESQVAELFNQSPYFRRN